MTVIIIKINQNQLNSLYIDTQFSYKNVVMNLRKTLRSRYNIKCIALTHRIAMYVARSLIATQPVTIKRRSPEPYSDVVRSFIATYCRSLIATQPVAIYRRSISQPCCDVARCHMATQPVAIQRRSQLPYSDVARSHIATQLTRCHIATQSFAIQRCTTQP